MAGKLSVYSSPNKGFDQIIINQFFTLNLFITMKKVLENFGAKSLSPEQMKKVTGASRPGVKCWCPGAGPGWCAGDCNHCGGREGCFAA